MRYRITRFRGQTPGREIANLAHEVACGIVDLIWGVVPDKLAKEELNLHEELKFHLGGPDWVIVQRTA